MQRDRGQERERVGSVDVPPESQETVEGGEMFVTPISYCWTRCGEKGTRNIAYRRIV